MADDKNWPKDKIKGRIDGNELDLSLCTIAKVPVRSLLAFPKVTILDLSCNKIHVLPDQFTQLINITQLDLSKNSLTELPADFGKLVRLKKLDVFSNHISSLPLSFRKLENLQWLDLKDNPIQDLLPDVVGDCLKPTECKACAKRTLVYLNYLNDKQERELMEKQRHARHLQAERDRAEEIENQKKREEKKRKKQEYEEMRRQRRLLNEATLDTSDMEGDNSKARPVISQADSTTDPIEAGNGSALLKWLMILSLVAAIGLGLAGKYYPDQYQMYHDQAAMHWRQFRATAAKHGGNVYAVVRDAGEKAHKAASEQAGRVHTMLGPHWERFYTASAEYTGKAYEQARVHGSNVYAAASVYGNQAYAVINKYVNVPVNDAPQ